VQQKIPCVFEINVEEGKGSRKWNDGSYQVSASSAICQDAKKELEKGIATEKVDGTSCFVSGFGGKVWLWVRRDVKPSKMGEKRFRKWSGGDGKFEWDVERDLKEIPENWMAMLNVERDASGRPVPNSTGHIPGWIPIDPCGRTHCWHLTALDLKHGLIALLRPNANDPACLEIAITGLQALEGKTLELIGTHINGNPYGLGSKNYPFHIYVEHGCFQIVGDIPLTFPEIQNWFQSDDGQIEGIVWHFPNGKLFKVHRHHLNLKWPIESPRLSRQMTRIHIDQLINDRNSPDVDHLINMIREKCDVGLPLCDLVLEILKGNK